MIFDTRKNSPRKVLVDDNRNTGASSYKSKILKNPEAIVTALLITSEAITFARKIIEILRVKNEENEFYQDDSSPWII